MGGIGAPSVLTKQQTTSPPLSSQNTFLGSLRPVLFSSAMKDSSKKMATVSDFFVPPQAMFMESGVFFFKSHPLLCHQEFLSKLNLSELQALASAPFSP